MLTLGDQIAVDGEVLTGAGLEIDESLLTGEAEPVAKQPGATVMSGSFVVAGSGSIRATAVGAEAYAFKLSSDARRFSLVKSELRTGIDKVIKLVSWLHGADGRAARQRPAEHPPGRGRGGAGVGGRAWWRWCPRDSSC